MVNDKVSKFFIEKNIENIKSYLKNKNIQIDNLDEILSKITVEIGIKKDYPYAKIDKTNSYKIIISEDIDENDKYKWLNHEMIHVISNNLQTTDEIHVGGIIVEDKEKDIWTGQYLNEAITEYINQSIIRSKYNDYYDRYIEALDYIINIIGEDIILKAYFTNNLELIVKNLVLKTGKTREQVMKFIDFIDYLYENEDYKIGI